MNRDELIKDCLAYAISIGHRAQINANSSVSFGRSYKSLTAEVLSEGNSENSLTLTLELAGQKSSRNFVITPHLSGKSMVDALKPLLAFATPDDAERLPVVTGTLSEDSSKFDKTEILPWVESIYSDIYSQMSTNTAGLAIENIGVNASVGTRIFANTDGAYKTHSSSSSSFFLGYSGKDADRAEVDWDGRSEPYLLNWNPSIADKVASRVLLKLAHRAAGLTSGEYCVALEPDLAGELVGELLGLLSGYAIAERLTPFTLADIGSFILPSWVTLTSTPHWPGLSVSKYFDGNGITTIPLSIARDGILEEIFLSKAAADRLGLEPNGHPGAINVGFFGNSNTSSLAGIPLLLTGLAWMHTIDTSTGNFTLEGEGIALYPDGSQSHYVKNIWVSGNICSLFATLLGALHDAPNYGTIRMPTIITAPLSLTLP